MLVRKQELCEKRRALPAERMQTLRVRMEGGTRPRAGQCKERGMPKRESLFGKRKGVERHCNLRTKSTMKLYKRR